MAMTINPLSFSPKNFERYKLELRAWSEMTEVSRTKQAIVIALSISEDDISEKVFNQLNLDDLKQEDGLDILIQFLDSLLGKDELTDTLEKFEDFENFQRADRQSIRRFLGNLMVDSARTGSVFKLDPGYLAAHKKDLLATEFVKKTGRLRAEKVKQG